MIYRFYIFVNQLITQKTGFTLFRAIRALDLAVDFQGGGKAA